jgi:hypothetical protein
VVSAFCQTKKGKATMKCLQLVLAECRKKYKGSSKRKKRASCEAAAHKKYGPKPKAKHKKH